jgi:crotonobetainyl-CoA:carnitine CoA-transferase CaiB-like acyl-CoA transferase
MSGVAPGVTGPEGPLAGIRVLDLSIAATGPYAATLLADQGAEVIKVERPGFGDIGRYVGVSVGGVSALFHSCNRGKRSVAVDPHTDDGRAIVLELARETDVFVQNFRPGVVDRLGVGYDAVRAVNPDVVYASLSGFGPTGPYAHKGAYDTVIQAYGGFAANQGEPDGEPKFLKQTAADKVTALYAAQAITAALFARASGRGGQHVELAMLDAVVSFLWVDAAGNEVLLESDGTLPSSFVATFRPFRFADGWGIATPTADKDFLGMCRAFGIQDDDPRLQTMAVRNQNREFVAEVMDAVYAVATTTNTEDAIARLEAETVPCGVVLSPADIVDDEHAITVEMFEDFDHPASGRVRQPRHPAQFANTPAHLAGRAPLLGEHTDEVLAELGYDTSRIGDLRALGTIG